MNKVLSDVALYVTNKVSTSDLDLNTYVGMDNMLPDKGGVTKSVYEPPKGIAISFKKGDILIGNIRPYFKKIWLATFDGGCSQDVLCIRSKGDIPEQFLYGLLSQDSFFAYDMAGAKGSKMPRGDKNHIMTYPIPNIEDMDKIGDFIIKINDKVANNNRINDELESMAKTIYDYWFLQFEFPNEEGKPYKSSGGKMVWNEELKREIPEGWEVGNLYDIADFNNGLACQKHRPIDDTKRLPVIKIKEMHDGITENTEWVKDNIPSKHIIEDGDVLFSWSATLETKIWSGGRAGLNQHIFKVVPKNVGKYYMYMQLSSYIINFIQMAESRKTTMGHITTEHLKQSRIAVPSLEIATKYDDIIKTNFNKIVKNNEETKRLTSLRDFLLPMLMNGQIGFKEGDAYEL